MRNPQFLKPLIWLILLDIALTIGNSYIPDAVAPARLAGSLVLFVAMATTMIVAARWVLEDY